MSVPQLVGYADVHLAPIIQAVPGKGRCAFKRCLCGNCTVTTPLHCRQTQHFDNVQQKNPSCNVSALMNNNVALIGQQDLHLNLADIKRPTHTYFNQTCSLCFKRGLFNSITPFSSRLVTVCQIYDPRFCRAAYLLCSCLSVRPNKKRDSNTVLACCFA